MKKLQDILYIRTDEISQTFFTSLTRFGRMFLIGRRDHKLNQAIKSLISIFTKFNLKPVTLVNLNLKLVYFNIIFSK